MLAIPSGSSDAMSLKSQLYRDAYGHSYRHARERFLDLAAGAAPNSDRITSHPHPLKGRDGEELATDVAILGDPDAKTVLIVNSATHGVEGFYGSGAQCGWLASALDTGVANAVPGNIKLIFVHAINPHGFSNIRRVNEDNIDLNRNFVDHGSARPENGEYGLVHPYLRPEVWSEDAIAAADEDMRQVAEDNGGFAYLNAILRGQYDHADGLFYGGRARTWSNETFRKILNDHCGHAETIAFLDLHTGLGPYGYAELICNARFPEAVETLRSWHGCPLTAPATPASESPRLNGNIVRSIYDECPKANILPVTVEFGTYDFPTVLLAHRADNWVYFSGDPDGPEGDKVRAQIKEALFPADKDWQDLVLFRTLQIIDRNIYCLSKL